MICVFCKKDSSESKSIEHIIPESLGNKSHTLPKGIVCDDCNNYFAIKIEKEVLCQPYFKSVRARNYIQSKKGKNIPEKGIIMHPEGGILDLYFDKGGLWVDAKRDCLFQLIKSGQVNKLYIPIYEEPENNNIPLSRLLAKMAMEALVAKVMNADGWQEEVVFRKELDLVRNYARYGNGGNKLWPYAQRRIYSEKDIFLDPEDLRATYEILHEFKFHFSEKMDLFFIVCIMGIEYVINMVGPEIESYYLELEKYKVVSFLFGPDQKRAGFEDN